MGASGSGHSPRSKDGPAASSDAYSGPERRQTTCDGDVEPVILTKKLADELDGIELDAFEVGDRLCLAKPKAALIVAEGWARPAAAGQRRRRT